MSDPLELLDTLYAAELGCAPGDFHSGRLAVVSHADVQKIRFAKGAHLVLFSIARETGGAVSVVPRLKAAADEAMRHCHAMHCPAMHGGTAWNDAFDALQSAVAPLIEAEYWFRGCRLYCAPDTFADNAFGEVREVSGRDETAAALHRTWGGPVFGQIVGGTAVAWAAVKPLSDIAWDLSVRTAPGHRGKGYAKSVVSAAVKHVFEYGKLATWGTDTDNTASLRTAHAVGFQDYGLDFGCVGRTR